MSKLLKGHSCDKPCSPSDYYEGGLCDRNGCYEATLDDKLKKDEYGLYIQAPNYSRIREEVDLIERIKQTLDEDQLPNFLKEVRKLTGIGK